MADNKQEEVANGVNAPAPAPITDFVQLVKDAVPHMGSTLFTRVNLDQHVTDAGLEALNTEYATQGYEVFSSGKSVLLLKQ